MKAPIPEVQIRRPARLVRWEPACLDSFDSQQQGTITVNTFNKETLLQNGRCQFKVISKVYCILAGIQLWKWNERTLLPRNLETAEKHNQNKEKLKIYFYVTILININSLSCSLKLPPPRHHADSTVCGCTGTSDVDGPVKHTSERVLVFNPDQFRHPFDSTATQIIQPMAPSEQQANSSVGYWHQTYRRTKGWTGKLR